MSSEEEARDDVQGQVLNETLNGLASRDDTDTPAACVICLSEISEACTATPCAHNNFDFLCLASWLQQKTSCPLCKAEVVEIQYDFTDKGHKTYRVPKIGLQPGSEPFHQERRQTFPPSHRARGSGQPSRGNLRNSRRAFLSSPTDPQVRARGALDKRRQVYRGRLLSLHVGTNPSSRYKDITLRQFQTDPDLLSRARTWIRRELQVFEFLSDDSETRSEDTSAEGDRRTRRRQNNALFVLEYVIAILKTVDIQESSGHAENLLSDFLGRENCRIFLHELRNFLRSPFSVEAWDKHVQYDESKAVSQPASREGSTAVEPEFSGGPGSKQMSDRYRPRRYEGRSRDRWARRRPRGAPRTGATDSWRPG